MTSGFRSVSTSSSDHLTALSTYATSKILLQADPYVGGGWNQTTVTIQIPDIPKPKCCDHCPAPFSFSVRQKGYFHPFPLTVGISSPLTSLLSCSFTLFHINLKSVDNSLIIYGLKSKVLVERSQCLLAQTHRTLTRSPITFSIIFSSSYKQG